MKYNVQYLFNIKCVILYEGLLFYDGIKLFNLNYSSRLHASSLPSIFFKVWLIPIFFLTTVSVDVDALPADCQDLVLKGEASVDTNANFLDCMGFYC